MIKYKEEVFPRSIPFIIIMDNTAARLRLVLHQSFRLFFYLASGSLALMIERSD